jgi:quercetin dioxygenase-like cupin family protein
MDRMDFEAQLRRDGFAEIVNGELKPNETRSVHAHDHDVCALVLEGGIALTCNGDERLYKPGDIFTMAAGLEHAERAGSGGIRYLAGRRRPAR